MQRGSEAEKHNARSGKLPWKGSLRPRESNDPFTADPHTLMPRPPGRTPPGSVRPPDLARPARSGPPARPSPPVRVRARSVDHDFGHGFYRVRCLLDLIALAAVSVTVTGTATVA